MNIAINGFGRIGRAALKILLERIDKGKNVNIVAVNDLASLENLTYLLKYDTVYGVYSKSVANDGSNLLIDGKKYKFFSEKDPRQLPWKDLEVDVVLECTGVFTRSDSSRLHIDAGAKKVIISAPAKDDGIKTSVMGVEDLSYDGELVSNASCTTNCVTPVISVMSVVFGVEKAMLTTVHAYTATQAIVDGPNKKDMRRGRAGAQNIIPSSTGAAKATAKAIPSFNNIFDGVALRVPVICGSISDVTLLLKKDVTVNDVNQAFEKAQDKPTYKGILKYSEEPLVSSDIIGTSYSAIVDGSMTRVVGGNLVKVMAWYDNEWGYSNRLVDMALLVMQV